MDEHQCKHVEDIAVMRERIDQIHEMIKGNGTKGLITKIDENTKWRYWILGILFILFGASRFI